MTFLKSRAYTIALLLCAAAWTCLGCDLLRAQATAAAVGPAPYAGFQLPTLGGSLTYAATVSESVIVGYNGNGGTGSSTNFSGDVGYLSRSETHPFSALYSGGYLASTGSQPNSVFQNLALSQVIRAGRWNFIFSNSTSYLPQTPINGFSGVPGVGDLGVIPVQAGGSFGQGILTRNDARVTNLTSGSVVRNLTGSTSVNATGSYAIERFFGSSNTQSIGFGNPGFGIDNNSVTGSVGVNHRIDARNSIGGNYSYSQYTYTQATPFTFTTQTGSVEYTRVLTKQITLDASAGPQRTSSSDALLSAPSINVFVDVDAAYVGERTTSSINYTRGVNNGSGIIEGARVDSISFRANRALSRVWSVAGTVGYAHSVSLPNLLLPAFSTQTVSAGAEASRSFRRNLFGFVSYTIQRQTTQGFAQSSDLYNGLSQIFGVGLTYSPSPIQLGRR